MSFDNPTLSDMKGVQNIRGNMGNHGGRMIEIRFHGRGGQGAVIGGKILAQAVFTEGKFVQAFPTFGVERRGAPVMAFVRADDERINLRSQIYTPDHLIILDPTLLNNEATFNGFRGKGWILINSPKAPEEFKDIPHLAGLQIATVDAGSIAIQNRLGSPMSPIVNTAILGAFCRVTEICSIDAILGAIEKGVPVKPEQNAKAAREAFDSVLFTKQATEKPENEPTDSKDTL
jgi:2-oxoacid:acceptor oxidoreductase gamma subunit (pyruvate/2-ketoisovalerate family)